MGVYMKRIVYHVLVVLMCFSFVGCGSRGYENTKVQEVNTIESAVVEEDPYEKELDSLLIDLEKLLDEDKWNESHDIINKFVLNIKETNDRDKFEKDMETIELYIDMLKTFSEKPNGDATSDDYKYWKYDLLSSIDNISPEYDGFYSEKMVKKCIELVGEGEWNKHVESYYLQLGHEEKNKLAQLEPTIGMTEDELLSSAWGKPEDINKTTYEFGVHEQWCYSGNRYVYLEDNIVTAIQE